MSGESLRDEFVQLYVNMFTESELIEIAEFNKTPTGQKALKVMPVLMQQGAQVGQQRVVENIDVLRQMIDEQSKTLKELQEFE